MEVKIMEKVLKLLEQDSRLTAAEVAQILGVEEAQVKAAIAAYESNGTILGYKTVIDWEKTDRQLVTAFIEVKVTPQKGEGFDNIAERIYSFPEVQSVYLMSGGFDLSVLIEGKSLKEVAHFVSERLATLECVISTATHFVLKKYKDYGVEFGPTRPDERSTFSL